MQEEVPEKIKLNALCRQFRDLASAGSPVNGTEARKIWGDMFLEAQKVLAPLKKYVASLGVDDADYMETINEKLLSVPLRPDTDPDNFSNLLTVSVKNGLRDLVRRRNKRDKYTRNESDLLPPRPNHRHGFDLTEVTTALDYHTKNPATALAILDESELAALKGAYNRCFCLLSADRLKTLQLSLEGDSMDEIGKKLGIPTGTVKSRLDAVRKHMIKHADDIAQHVDALPMDELDMDQRAQVDGIMLSAISEAIAAQRAAVRTR